MRGIVNHWHGLAANTVLILAGLHAAAALFHHYVRKDQLLRRMWSGEISGPVPCASMEAVTTVGFEDLHSSNEADEQCLVTGGQLTHLKDLRHPAI